MISIQSTRESGCSLMKARTSRFNIVELSHPVEATSIPRTLHRLPEASAETAGFRIGAAIVVFAERREKREEERVGGFRGI